MNVVKLLDSKNQVALNVVEEVLKRQAAAGVDRKFEGERCKVIIVETIARWLQDAGLLPERIEVNGKETDLLPILLVASNKSLPTLITQGSTLQKKAIALGLYPEGEKRKAGEGKTEANEPSAEDILKGIIGE